MTMFNNNALLPNTINDFNRKYLLNETQVGQLATYLNTLSGKRFGSLFQDDREYFVSLRGYPFDVTTYIDNHVGDPNKNTERNIRLGVVETNVQGIPINSYDNYIHMCDIPINEYFHSFLDYEPYTSLSLYLPFYGYVQLPTNQCMGYTLSVDYLIDFNTGQATAVISRNTSVDMEKLIVCQIDFDIGIEIPMGTQNTNERMRSLAMLGINTAVTTASFFTGNWKNKLYTPITHAVRASVKRGAISESGDLASNLISSFHKEQAQGTIDNSKNKIAMPTQCLLTITRPRVNENIMDYTQMPPVLTTDYKHKYGVPLLKNELLSGLSGYTVVDEIHLKNMTPATETEIDEIKDLLKSGVFL